MKAAVPPAHIDPPKVAPLAEDRFKVQLTISELLASRMRDGLQCSFVSAGGRRCTEKGFLELDHQQPYAKGGAHTVENNSPRGRVVQEDSCP